MSCEVWQLTNLRHASFQKYHNNWYRSFAHESQTDKRQGADYSALAFGCNALLDFSRFSCCQRKPAVRARCTSSRICLDRRPVLGDGMSAAIHIDSALSSLGSLGGRRANPRWAARVCRNVVRRTVDVQSTLRRLPKPGSGRWCETVHRVRRIIYLIGFFFYFSRFV